MWWRGWHFHPDQRAPRPQVRVLDNSRQHESDTDAEHSDDRELPENPSRERFLRILRLFGSRSDRIESEEGEEHEARGGEESAPSVAAAISSGERREERLAGQRIGWAICLLRAWCAPRDGLWCPPNLVGDRRPKQLTEYAHSTVGCICMSISMWQSWHCSDLRRDLSIQLINMFKL